LEDERRIKHDLERDQRRYEEELDKERRKREDFLKENERIAQEQEDKRKGVKFQDPPPIVKKPQVYHDANKPMEGHDNSFAPGQAPPEIQPTGPANHTAKANYTLDVFEHAKPA